MPIMADIVIKKADNTTDVTYTALQAAGGDGIAARWANKTVGTTPAEYPSFAVKAQSNGPATSRRVTGTFRWPATQQDSGGNIVIAGGGNGSFTYLMPQNLPSTTIKEQAYQFGNLIASAIIKQTIEEGFAPRSS